MTFQSVIGLEIHAQLLTASKIFCGCSTAFGAPPNSHVCPVCLGLPGALPVLNRTAVDLAIRAALALGCTIQPTSIFARKNYFYPDLPKGYQISQYELPIVRNGHIEIQIDGEKPKVIGITRAHLEEDAGKSLHEDFHNMTGIDLNRAGTPLLEIVSEPDLRSAVEAVTYMKKIHTLVRYIEICDGNMQEGSFRCDANVSVRPKGQGAYGTRTELKNLNSFRFVEKAINYEIERQIAVIESGGEVLQETRLYDPDKDETRSMRQKEEANDYRYFPDPDLLPLKLSDEFIHEAQDLLPELPDARKKRFMDRFDLSDYEAGLLTANRRLADYYEATVSASGGEAKHSANWIIGELAGALNKAGKEITESPVSAEHLGGLIKRIADHTVSGKIAKRVFDAMWNGEGDADCVIEAKGLKQVTNTSAIAKLIEEVIEENPQQLEQYRSGKEKLLSYFVGQVMKKSKGKANPQQVNELLKKMLV